MALNFYPISGLLVGIEFDDQYSSVTLNLFVFKVVLTFQQQKWNRFYDDSR